MSRGWSQTTLSLRRTKIDPLGSHPQSLPHVTLATNGTNVRLEFITFSSPDVPYAGTEVAMPLSEWEKIVAEIEHLRGRDEKTKETRL